MLHTRTQTITSLLLILLTSASAYLVLRSANDEPYTQFSLYGCLSQVGLGSILIFAWIQYAAFVLFQVFKKQISRWWLLSLALMAVVLFYLRFCPLGYIEDILQFANIQK